MEKDKLYFYSKSKNTDVGEGTNEYVNDKSKYNELNNIDNWRKILSNFHEYDFQYNGKWYRTIEHAFQSKKIELEDKEKSEWFSIDSNNDIGKGNGTIAKKNRKLVKLSNENIKKWSLIKNEIMYEISYEKYKQCLIAKEVLKETKDSELWHIVLRSKPIRFIHLEKIREII